MNKNYTTLIKTLQKPEEKTYQTPPIWFMRQAGRYLPEYKEVRKSTGTFLDLCYNPAQSAEVTLQPIKRFGFDAAIIFSDILVLPNALGWDVRFEENIGPVLRQFKTEEDFKYFQNPDNAKLQNVYEAIEIVRAKLPKSTSLIGFAGSPWTVVSYLLEGKSKQDFSVSKSFLYNNNKLSEKLIDFITNQTIIHLINQAKAGCDVLQLFDSWAGMLAGEEYERFVIQPTIKIVSAIKKQFPNLPVIGFPKGSSFLYENYIAKTGVDIIGVDQFIPLDIMQKWQQTTVVQGNLDPVILLTNKDVIAKKVDEILTKLGSGKFIFNLGHGISQYTPIENVEFAVNYIRNFKKQ